MSNKGSAKYVGQETEYCRMTKNSRSHECGLAKLC